MKRQDFWFEFWNEAGDCTEQDSSTCTLEKAKTLALGWLVDCPDVAVIVIQDLDNNMREVARVTRADLVAA